MNATERRALKQFDPGGIFSAAAKRIGVSVADLVDAAVGRPSSDAAARAYREEARTFPQIPSDAWPYRCGDCNAEISKAHKRACVLCGAPICHACGATHAACKIVDAHRARVRQAEARETVAAIAALAEGSAE